MTTFDGSDGRFPPSMFSHVFASCSSIVILLFWLFRYQFHERKWRFDPTFNIVANKGRKIGMQATTNPRFLSSLKFSMSDLAYIHSREVKTYNDHNTKGTWSSWINVSYDAWTWIRNDKTPCGYLHVRSMLLGFNVILLPIPQAAVLYSHQHPLIRGNDMARLTRHSASAPQWWLVCFACSVEAH